jgi:hypothetical protein
MFWGYGRRIETAHPQDEALTPPLYLPPNPHISAFTGSKDIVMSALPHEGDQTRPVSHSPQSKAFQSHSSSCLQARIPIRVRGNEEAEIGSTSPSSGNNALLCCRQRWQSTNHKAARESLTSLLDTSYWSRTRTLGPRDVCVS